MSPQPSNADWTDAQRAEWEAWLASRPPEIRAAAEKYPPGQPYRLTTTGQKVWLASYSEPGETGGVTCRVWTSALGATGAELDPDGEGPVIEVFGIPIVELEPWS